MKLLEQLGDGSEIIPLNSPGGSTLQWGTGRGVMCQAPLVDIVLVSIFVYTRSGTEKSGPQCSL